MALDIFCFAAFFFWKTNRHLGLKSCSAKKNAGSKGMFIYDVSLIFAIFDSPSSPISKCQIYVEPHVSEFYDPPPVQNEIFRPVKKFHFLNPWQNKLKRISYWFILWQEPFTTFFISSKVCMHQQNVRLWLSPCQQMPEFVSPSPLPPKWLTS